MICISILIAGLCTIYSTVDRPCFQLQQCSVPISRQKTPTGESFGGAGPVGVLGTKEGKRGGGAGGQVNTLCSFLKKSASCWPFLNLVSELASCMRLFPAALLFDCTNTGHIHMYTVYPIPLALTHCSHTCHIHTVKSTSLIHSPHQHII